MSEPVKHHYVPEVYLKPFADSNKQFFQLRKKFKKIASKSVGQVCYEKNYFKIQRKETLFFYKIEDVLYIERKIFTELENQYPFLLKKVSFPSLQPFTMTWSSVGIFLKTLINIKRRNPSVRQILSENLHQYLNSNEFFTRVSPGLEFANKIDKIDSVEYFENYLKEINTDGSRLSDSYLSGFMEEGRRLQKNIINTLMSCTIFVFHAPAGHQFITSDNPGFVLNGDIVLNFGGLGGEFAFMFPLTPQCLLVIDKKHPDKSRTLNKIIYPKYINVDLVNRVNEYTMLVANDKVFSFSKTLLENIIADHSWN